MEYTKAIEYVLSELKENLPERLTYHSLNHTLSVIEYTRLIAQEEGVDGRDFLLLKVASAYHDCGFLRSMEDHEEVGCQIVSEVLPGLGFSEDDVSKIQGMILATKLPQTPQSHLEEILCDADLGYIGGSRYFETVTGLEKELKSNGVSLNETSWLDMQIGFLKAHSYFTKYASKAWDEKKKRVIQQLEARRNA